MINPAIREYSGVYLFSLFKNTSNREFCFSERQLISPGNNLLFLHERARKSDYEKVVFMLDSQV